MGFQFLALVGGKSLLLAKLALILSAIQGLKRYATSGLNYGYYQYPPFPNYYDHRIDTPHSQQQQQQSSSYFQ